MCGMHKYIFFERETIIIMAGKRKKDFITMATVLSLLPFGGGFIGVAFYIILANPVGGFTPSTALMSFSLLGCGVLGLIGLSIGNEIFRDTSSEAITFKEIETELTYISHYARKKGFNELPEGELKDKYKFLYLKAQDLGYQVQNGKLSDSNPSENTIEQYIKIIQEKKALDTKVKEQLNPGQDDVANEQQLESLFNNTGLSRSSSVKDRDEGF